MKLSKSALKAIEDSKTIQGKIADACRVSFWTVLRWVESNDQMLTTASVLAILATETELTQEEILETASA